MNTADKAIGDVDVSQEFESVMFNIECLASINWYEG